MKHEHTLKVILHFAQTNRRFPFVTKDNFSHDSKLKHLTSADFVTLDSSSDSNDFQLFVTRKGIKALKS